AQWTNLAKRAEQLGYSTLVVPDHFIEQIAPVPALMAAAAVTRELRVGSMVFCNDFRHPVMLAKEAATIDFLSNGRFELGIGAGWLKVEYDAVGFKFESPSVRVSRLEESLKIIKGYFSKEPFVFSGKYYNVNGVVGIDQLPLSVQKPHPPILIGGGGRRMLSIAAREADIVSIAVKVKADGTGPDVADAKLPFIQKVRWVQEAADDRFDDIELNILTWTASITDDSRQVASKLRGRKQITEETLLSLPYTLIGSEEQIVEELEKHRDEYGISYYIIWD
ncbi:TIGR03621 family F420-dependent LLM class oxidoreductase, partial [Candidatus Bathyarchaeota archaeon]|nr:TIGR03621 family F420-dependent LLM class oxidoreductase [Candidatus Bathyarchaeota archaeon]